MNFSDTERARLLALITEKSFYRADEGESFELASGATSTFYFDMKPSLLDPEGAALIGKAILDHLAETEFDTIGGMAVGAIPIVAAILSFVVFFIALLSLPGILAGWGLLNYKPWARILAIVLSALNLLSVPIGTVIGAYGLWVLLNTETERLFLSPPAKPTPPVVS